MNNLFITLIIGSVGGMIAMKFKVPAGTMIGAMVSVAFFNIITGDAFLPQNVRILTQIAAGAFIGTGIRKKDVLDLKYMIKPAVLMIFSMIILDLLMGYLMHRVTGIDLVTSLFASAPAGVVDMSLISSDLGADSSKVAILQLVRLMSVLIFFPTIMKFVSDCLTRHDTREHDKQINNTNNLHVASQMISETIKRENSTKKNCINLMITMTIASIAGLLGYKLSIPAGAMSFAMIAVGAFNIFTNRGYMPRNMTRITQMCAGTLIGSTMTLGDVISLKGVMFPAFILLVGIIIVNLLIGILISRISKFELITALLASAPGGMTDMALIAKDLGGDGPKVAILQLTRYVCIVAIFPILIKYICS
jgi:uncharacterized protein